MTIHFISCAFVFCISVDKTAVFSALFLKRSHVTEKCKEVKIYLMGTPSSKIMPKLKTQIA